MNEKLLEEIKQFLDYAERMCYRYRGERRNERLCRLLYRKNTSKIVHNT